jgi:hypothetical protein
MALSTNMVEIILHVAWVSNIIKIVGVTTEAISRSVLISTRVAGDALKGYMRPGQRELSIGMIECPIIPSRCVMALRTVMAEIVSHMVGISCSVIIIGVAGVAIIRGVVIAIGMTGNTLQADMRPGQREMGIIMIESSRIPS